MSSAKLSSTSVSSGGSPRAKLPGGKFAAGQMEPIARTPFVAMNPVSRHEREERLNAMTKRRPKVQSTEPMSVAAQPEAQPNRRPGTAPSAHQRRPRIGPPRKLVALQPKGSCCLVSPDSATRFSAALLAPSLDMVPRAPPRAKSPVRRGNTRPQSAVGFSRGGGGSSSASVRPATALPQLSELTASKSSSAFGALMASSALMLNSNVCNLSWSDMARAIVADGRDSVQRAAMAYSSASTTAPPTRTGPEALPEDAQALALRRHLVRRRRAEGRAARAEEQRQRDEEAEAQRAELAIKRQGREQVAASARAARQRAAERGRAAAAAAEAQRRAKKEASDAMEAAERAARGPPTVRVRLDLPSLAAAQRYGGPPATKVRARIVFLKVKERPASPVAADAGGGAGDDGGGAETEAGEQQADAAPPAVAPASAPAASDGAVGLDELAAATPTPSHGIMLFTGSAKAFLPR